MSDFGKRLAEERKRLGLNQTDFGKIGGVTKTSQVNYEAGERSPNVDYWQAVASAGVDVTYVLTGVRLTPPGQAAPVSSDDPLVMRKRRLKMMIDQADSPQVLDAVQNDLERDEQYREVRRELADLREQVQQRQARHAA